MGGYVGKGGTALYAITKAMMHPTTGRRVGVCTVRSGGPQVSYTSSVLQFLADMGE